MSLILVKRFIIRYLYQLISYEPSKPSSQINSTATFWYAARKALPTTKLTIGLIESFAI